MIHRALVYLLLMRLKNVLREFVRHPGRVLALACLIVLFVGMGVTGWQVGDMTVPQRGAVLVALLALYLLLSLFGGLGEPGPIFRPSDVDFVFPAPFRRRDVLVYHLMPHYLPLALLSLFYAIFLGLGAFPNPALAWVGTYLCLLVCTHLQTGMTLLSARVSERAFGRLRGVHRVGLVLVLAVAALLAIGALADIGDVGRRLQSWVETPVARIVLYPAAAVRDLAFAPSPAEVVGPLLGLLAVVVASFALVLAFPVNVVETAATRDHRRRPGKRRGRAVAPRPATAGLALRGAGAVSWVNLLTLRRRLRIVVGVLVMLLFVLLFVGLKTDEDARGGPPAVLVLLAYFALLANLPLGFKGHREHLEGLKTLPVGATRLAVAEVAVPVLVLFVLQAGVTAVLAATGRLAAHWLLPALAGYALLDVAAVAVSDLFQLGRDRRSMSFFLVTAQMFVIVLSTVPALLTGVLVFHVTASRLVGAGAAALVQALVDVLLLHLLGRRFAAYEPPAHVA